MLSFRLARASLKSHKLRTFLTALGVAVGVFIITLILLISSGLKKGITDQISNLDGDILLVRGGNSTDSATGMEAFSPLAVAPITTLTTKDFDEISKISEIEFASPMMFLGGEISAGANFYDRVSIVATNANFPRVFGLEISEGNWFSADESAKNWVILGDKLARGLLGTAESVGQVVNFKGQNFTVVGVLSRVDRPISLAGVDVDKTAFISMSNGLKFSGGTAEIGQIAAKIRENNSANSKEISQKNSQTNSAKNSQNTSATSNKNSQNLEQKINETLAKNHADKSDFSVVRGDNSAKTLASWLDTLSVAALIFAGVSLFVGGIGIMNIMLVSVAERIHEIGIRKAVGARARNILNQFLVEAILISFGGGIFGVVLAFGAGYLITLQFSLPLVFDWQIFAVGLGIPVLVGILFGIFPAFRAARQDPISALKQLG